MSKKILLISILIIILAGAATAAVLFLYPYEPTQPPPADDTGSTEQGVAEVVAANNKFAFEFYKELGKTEKGNIFYSPYSIFAALAMTYEGADGQTADEMKKVFHFPQSSILRPNFAAVYNGINGGSADYELRTGNALWVQQDFPLLADYTSAVEKFYGGKATNLDFVNENEASRQTINSFIAEQTNNRIKDLIPQGVLDAMTRLVLTNAVYFKGTWQWKFDPAKTQIQDFYITADETVQVPMMSMSPEEAEFNYAKTDELQILEMPYKGDKISMLILLPTSDLASIELDLTLEKIDQYRSLMQSTKMDTIAIPKFEFDTKYFLNETLSDLGMPTAFLEIADFSKMTGKKDLFIGNVIHQAYVKVDEEGTEAAAATAVTMELTAIMDQNIFYADHPFIFLITEKNTGNILFFGRVANPVS